MSGGFTKSESITINYNSSKTITGSGAILVYSSNGIGSIPLVIDGISTNYGITYNGNNIFGSKNGEMLIPFTNSIKITNSNTNDASYLKIIVYYY